ncbi:hypothetical protein ACMWPH_02880 [Helicobacter pylori]|uniref:hypothetical protein n=1 Tax=Helicobacter pylori TaxID=210 RepID=UPI0039DF3E99
MELEPLKAIDLEVLKALNKQAYLPKTADKISKDLNIDYYYTLKIFNKLEKKGLCDQWVVNKKKEKETKNNFSRGFRSKEEKTPQEPRKRKKYYLIL